MNCFLLEFLCCPSCKEDFSLNIVKKKNDRILYGSLICSKCLTETPILCGFPLFTETCICTEPANLDKLIQLEEKLFKKEDDYVSFLHEKSKRSIIDSYAAFQPFNESTRAFYPFIPKIRTFLTPGDLILDTWCRTGWSGEYLSGIFPEQMVISIWESNSDVLGYRGFRHWLNEANRSKNLEILFHSPSDPLPLKDKVISLVHGLDSLHRYKQSTFIRETSRVTKDQGAIFFPHVHLTNAEPNPYFERGGTQYHGTFYKAFFNQFLPDRETMVFSEPKLFAEGERLFFSDQSNTSDYNGLIAIVPKEWKGEILHLEQEPLNNSYCLQNPLLHIDIQTGNVVLDPQGLFGQVESLLERHPIYLSVIQKHVPFQMSADQCQVIYWSEQLLTGTQIASKMNVSLEKLEELVSPLIVRQIIQLAPVSESMAKLQNFYSNALFRVGKKEETLAFLLRNAFTRFSSRPLLKMEGESSFLTFEEISNILPQICKTLMNHGLQKGDLVLMCSSLHAECFLIFWAAVSMGCVFVPIDPTGGTFFIQHAMTQVEPKIIFCDQKQASFFKNLTDIPQIVFDDEDWLSEDKAGLSSFEVFPEDPAVILYTSGTTGIPKGIVLSQGSLYRSGELFANSYGWDEKDTILSLGMLNTVSGLRNPAIATLHAGASFLVAVPDSLMTPLKIVENIHQYQVTIFSTVPMVLKNFLEYSNQIEKRKLSTLRSILSTGSSLSMDLVSEFQKTFPIPISDYYGLTETCGFCFGFKNEIASSIGLPVGCITRIEENELEISSANLMSGYYKNPELTDQVIKNGWFRTGDLVKKNENEEYILIGRKQEMIKDSKGNLVLFSEIEAFLQGHPEIADSCICHQNDKIVAFIVPASQAFIEEDLTKSLKNKILKELGKSKVPSGFIYMKELPRGTNGKVLKARLVHGHS